MPDVPERPDYRPDPPYADGAISTSTVCKLNNGKERRYPSLADYVELYKRIGIKDLDDLVTNYGHLIGELFFNWIRSGQLGCIFAANLAKDPRSSRWLPIVQLKALEQGARLPELLNTQLDAAAERNEAVAVIFPDVVTSAEIVQLTNLLCADPSGRWYRTDAEIDPDPNGVLGLIGIRWVLPSDKSVNYVLGFANIETMPQTRRSPFTALFLRVCEEKRTPSHKEDGRIQVHLADLDSLLNPQAIHDQVWESTKAARANLVEPNRTAAARARVTFSIPIEEMGQVCPSRNVVIVKEPK